ncbi:hypothetical protein X943_001708 [Babesia divergens]|uniref:Ribosome-binding factor A n=1 Tax=Babesia divergens TaxID=32595 RepID=A0AAD9GD53_BABDI|nr:hypothetical protein X943_001708 [Babesia divergens]
MEINTVFERVTGFKVQERSDAPHSVEKRTNRRIPHNSHSTESKTDSIYDFENLKDEFARLGNFESMRRRGDFEDLTHEERYQLQHFEARSRLSNPGSLLNKNRARLDPRRDAKHIVRCLDDADNMECHGSDDAEADPRETFLVKENRFDEIVSRIRAKMRQEKVDTSNINKAKVPNFNGIIVDPIAKHVKRRCLRINAMIKEHLEQIITCNDPSFIFGDLKGISISLKRVEMTSGKSTIKCYYTIMGANVDDSQIQEILEKAQKKVRFCLARKLELGYTPPVMFLKANDSDVAEVKKIARLPEHAFNLPLESTVKALGEQFHKKMVAF